MRVLVTGVGGGVGQSVMKSLRSSSLSPWILAVDADPLAAGLYRADAAALIPFASDPAFVEEIVRLVRRHRIDAVIPGSDPELPVLARGREAVEADTGVVIIVSRSEVVETGWDKARTVAFLAQQGLRAPRSATELDRARMLGSETGYPIVVKPRFGSASRGVVMAGNDEELERAWQRTSEPIAQERLDGDECTCGTFTDSDGVVRGTIILRRTLSGGATYRAFIERNEVIEAYVTAIALALRPRGPCNIQLRETIGGPAAFEFNPRFSGTTAARGAAGFVEVEAALRHFVLGEDVPPLKARRLAVLRYWNEVFVDSAAIDELRSKREASGTPGEVRSWP